nr:putative adenylate kinase isoenzyme 6 [Ipomoea batatas]
MVMSLSQRMRRSSNVAMWRIDEESVDGGSDRFFVIYSVKLNYSFVIVVDLAWEQPPKSKHRLQPPTTSVDYNLRNPSLLQKRQVQPSTVTSELRGERSHHRRGFTIAASDEGTATPERGPSCHAKPNDNHSREQKLEKSGSTSQSKRKPTFLQKLRGTDIRRDNQHLLQVFRFMVMNSFFTERLEKPLKFSSVIVKESENQNVDIARLKTEGDVFRLHRETTTVGALSLDDYGGDEGRGFTCVLQKPLDLLLRVHMPILLEFLPHLGGRLPEHHCHRQRSSVWLFSEALLLQH